MSGPTNDQLLEDRLRWLVREARRSHWTLNMSVELTEKAPALLELIERLRKIVPQGERSET